MHPRHRLHLRAVDVAHGLTARRRDRSERALLAVVRALTDVAYLPTYPELPEPVRGAVGRVLAEE